MAPLAITDTLALKHTDRRIPQIGFGVWQSQRNQCVESCTNALKAGYRHIDTAQGYSNEAEVGEAVQKSGIPREDIFITTKYVARGKNADEAYESAVESVKKCDPRPDGYVDLFLIHMAAMGSERRKMLWQVLERLRDEGKAKTIGVSNWGPHHLDELKSYAKAWPPAVNQIEVCSSPPPTPQTKNRDDTDAPVAAPLDSAEGCSRLLQQERYRSRGLLPHRPQPEGRRPDAGANRQGTGRHPEPGPHPVLPPEGLGSSAEERQPGQDETERRCVRFRDHRAADGSAGQAGRGRGGCVLSGEHSG